MDTVGAKVEGANQRISVHEVLDSIFRLSSAPDLASMALVCVSWSEGALDLLWKDNLQSVLPLLSILAPLTKVDGSWEYGGDGLENAKWARFRRYADRVQAVKHSDLAFGEEGGQILANACIGQLYLHTPSDYGPLLPHLVYLDWTASATRSFVHVWAFLSPSLQSLILTSVGDEDQDKTFARSLRHLARRPAAKAFSLAHLDLRWLSYSCAEMESGIILFLRVQQDLASLKLSRISTNKKVALAISTLRKLTELHLKLTFANLTTLDPFLSTMTETPFPSLRLLDLSFFARNSPGGLSFPAIKPLLSLHSLEVLKITSSVGFRFAVQDVKEMGWAWPRLTILHLKGTGSPAPYLPIASLVTFAETFLVLQEFAMDVSDSWEHLVNQAPSPFEALRTLSLGDSRPPIGREQTVAEFLAKVCPPATNIVYVEGWPGQGDVGGWDVVIAKMKGIWAERERGGPEIQEGFVSLSIG